MVYKKVRVGGTLLSLISLCLPDSCQIVSLGLGVTVNLLPCLGLNVLLRYLTRHQRTYHMTACRDCCATLWNYWYSIQSCVIFNIMIDISPFFFIREFFLTPLSIFVSNFSDETSYKSHQKLALTNLAEPLAAHYDISFWKLRNKRLHKSVRTKLFVRILLHGAYHIDSHV